MLVLLIRLNAAPLVVPIEGEMRRAKDPLALFSKQYAEKTIIVPVTATFKG